MKEERGEGEKEGPSKETSDLLCLVTKFFWTRDTDDKSILKEREIIVKERKRVVFGVA